MTEHLLYGQLAKWWPLISPPQEYDAEAAFTCILLESARIPVQDVLELGSGGGHNAFHLKSKFSMTLVDLSAEMLDVSMRLNPECMHFVGDMRDVRLAGQFDAVFIHDAIDYMLTEQDLQLALGTAFAHCRPGGVVVIIPDATTGTFETETAHGGTDGQDGVGVRYLSWSWDPEPADTETLTEYTFLLRDRHGVVRSVHETHRTGLFSEVTWLRVLSEAGFRARSVREETDEDRNGRITFIGDRPL